MPKNTQPPPRSTPPRGDGPPPVSEQTNPAEAADSVELRPNNQPTREEIRKRAFALWEQAGRPDGSPEQYWLEAEKELSNPR